MPNNVGFGEVGIGSPTLWHINTQNPANLVYNVFSTFQTGLEVERRKFSGTNVSGTAVDGGLRFLSYAFPMKLGKWTSSFGVLPYSLVSYNTFSVREIEDATETLDNKGDGGITQFYWSHGFYIVKNLSLGVRFNYTFGSINRETFSTIEGDNIIRTRFTYDNEISYSGINLLFGALYNYELSEKDALRFGIIYSYENKLKTTINRTLYLVTGVSSNNNNQFDIEKSKGSYSLPSDLGFGVSYARHNNYTIGLDIATQRWGTVSNHNDSLIHTIKIAAGLEWIPDHDNINSYFSRVKYRIGFNYHELPFLVKNQSITDIGINFGFSLPVRGGSGLDFAFKFGQLGKTENDLVKENYYKIIFGVTINDRWFIKRKYN